MYTERADVPQSSSAGLSTLNISLHVFQGTARKQKKKGEKRNKMDNHAGGKVLCRFINKQRGSFRSVKANKSLCFTIIQLRNMKHFF